MSYPGRVLTFLLSLGGPVWFSSPLFLLYRFSFRMFSCSYFILLCYRYLLLWVWVFCKLGRLSGQPAEARAQAYGVCFEGVRDIGKLFYGLQQMGRVHQGRVWRPWFSCRSYELRPLPAVSSTVFKVGVCH